MEIDKYLGIFIDESKENLQKLNESLLKLEKNTDDLEILNDIFRVAHTLKGMSRTMGYNDIADLTHNMENVLDPLRSGELKADSNVIDVLFACLDKLEELVDKVINANYEDKKNDIDSIIEDLQAILNESKTETGKKEIVVAFNEYEQMIIKQALAEGKKVLDIEVKIEDECLLPAARAYMVVSALESFGDNIKTVPTVDEIEKGDFDKVFKLFLITKSDEAEIQEKTLTVSEIEKVKIANVEIGEAKKTSEQKLESKEQAGEQSKVDVTKTTTATASPTALPKTIRVNADRLDKLMNLVGELVINRTRISQLAEEEKLNELISTIGLMGNITGDLQEIVMKLRMVPIEQVFNRFPRLVRDLSKKLNKDINLKIEGKDTEIDRIVIDEIGDPLIHLIRNSLDHGLESPEDRINNGKSSKGTLQLSAFNEGDNIIIKVADDGRGIDPDKIKKKAIEKGVITQENAVKLSEKETLDLIFAPGFSTHDVATDLSGRGVGMDVVKSKVNSLGGNVSIVSKVNEGTTITISLPSTMAIVQSLLIKVGEEIYATPLNYISEVIDIKTDEIKKVQNNEVIVLRGNTLPLVRLDEILEVPEYEQDPMQPITVMIVKSQNKQLGVIVSELIGQQEVVIKPIDKKLCTDNYISGATTLGSGKVALIINVNALF